jgi:sialate O-acetylesterase
LINTSWGGTACEAWTSLPTLQANPEYQPMLQHWESIPEPLNPNRPSNLFNGMLAPLKGFKFRGAIWYQGEANVGRGEQYRTLFPTMINDWRNYLAQGEQFPFYFVQIAPFRYEGRPPVALAELWDAQLHAFRSVPNVRMATTCDIGNLKDIHPANKQDVGKRLALWALHDLYDQERRNPEPPIVPCGPVFREHQIDGSKIRIKFDYASPGLVAAESEQLSWFTICGADGQFAPAQAKIEGEEVVVWSPDVAEPKHVRFAWDDSAVPNLFNQAGLPAAPFRTDRFELLSKGVNF